MALYCRRSMGAFTVIDEEDNRSAVCSIEAQRVYDLLLTALTLMTSYAAVIFSVW